MVGKGTLIVIIGFSAIFAIAGQYWNRESVAAMDNFVQYHGQANVYGIASAGANIGCDSLFQNINCASFPMTGSFAGGSYRVTLASANGSAGQRYATLTSVGTFEDVAGTYIDTVQVLLRMRQFSQYQFFSNSENGTYWITGDTVTGPVATNDYLYISGSPVFYGQASARLGLSQKPGSSPQFLSGLQTGTSIPMADVVPTANVAGSNTFQPSNTTKTNYQYDVYFDFQSNGKVNYKTVLSYDSSYTKYYWTYTTKVSVTSPTTSVDITTLAPNGVIAVSNGNAHVEGVVNGQVTVVAQQGDAGSSRSGNIFIDNDITYTTDPSVNPSCTDLLGLVAENNVTLTGTNYNAHIDAAIYAENGSFSYENYDKGSPLGRIYLNGSIANKTRGAVGTFSTYTNTLSTGYLKSYKYDPRLASLAPPFFPFTGNFGVMSWRETPPQLPHM